MKTAYYRIANHLIAVHLEKEEDIRLLPSYEPFAVEIADDTQLTEPVVSHVYVESSFAFASKDDEIGQFDCGGINHGVYQQTDGGYIIEVGSTGEGVSSIMQANADFSECHVVLTDISIGGKQFGLNNSIMMAFAFSTVEQLTVLIHSSVIRKDGKGYMMTAPSGTGKSTHTRLWYDNLPGCDLMNDDNPVIRVIDGVPTVFGSPWSGKTPCYRNIQAPVGAIVRLHQRKKNEIRQLSVIEALAELLPAVSIMKWDSRIYNNVCKTCSAIIAGTRIYELGCLPDADAAHLCYNTVKS